MQVAIIKLIIEQLHKYIELHKEKIAILQILNPKNEVHVIQQVATIDRELELLDEDFKKNWMKKVQFDIEATMILF